MITVGRVKARAWHDGRGDEPNCLLDYLVATSPAKARAVLRERDKGLCAECGEYSTDWQGDHRIPLWKAPRAGEWSRRIWYWSISNLQTLCSACHFAKTAREAAERAHHNRLADRQRNRGPRAPLPF